MSGTWLTYPQTGATLSDDPLPPGYRHIRRRQVVGRGREVFERAATGLLTWQVHRAAGITVVPPARLRAGAALRVRLGWGAFSVGGPCLIVGVVDEPDRRGFAYGTLPGHVECGEEAFLVRIEPDGRVVAEVCAFSLAATPLARVAGRLGERVQDLVTARYLAGFARVARGTG
jgi:uncharacterized protein (UPF0548 family)